MIRFCGFVITKRPVPTRDIPGKWAVATVKRFWKWEFIVWELV